jgi:O-acetylhomoserine/O-acetylserine sulfhydrylase-like pyridoxal-dependent enzyme
MSDERDKSGASTRAVHGGEREGKPRVGDSITTPIVQSATFWFRDTQEVIAYQATRRRARSRRSCARSRAERTASSRRRA